MDIQRLRYFLEVARQKNFSRAAEICHVSQPSLSQQIKKLEEEVDGPLFLRNRGRITLSPLGESFLKYAQTIMASVASAEEFVAETRSNARRTIRFGAIPTIAPYIVPQIFAAVSKSVPGIKFELLESQTEFLTEALTIGTIDFAIMSPPTSIDNICDHLTLRRDELLLTLPANHPLAKARSITPAKLNEESIIMLEDSHCLARQVSAYCATAGLTPDVSIRGSQIETLLRLVELGFGLTFTPRIAVDDSKKRKLVFRQISKDPCYREIRLVWLQQPILARSQKLTINAIEEFFGLAEPVSALPKPH
ncbi:hydrogen peroxide-inducible genes activator [bacterium]|nr:hydrogen peroxide-inducible genes activator [bacterium]